MKISMYETAICCAATTMQRAYFVGGRYVAGYPLGLMGGCIPELVETGMLEQVEKWPVPVFLISSAGRERAMAIFSKHGYHPYYIVPGLLSVREWGQG